MLNQIKTVLLLGFLSLLLVGIGGAIGGNALWLFAAFAVVMNIGAYFFSDKLVLKMHGAREVSEGEAPELHALVGELARRADMLKPRVCIIDDPQPNAFATGRNPKHGVVAVTTGIMRILTPREMRGVLAHELAHIRNRDILVSSIAATVASAISSIADWLTFSAIFGGSNSDEEGEGSAGGSLLMAFVAPMAAMLVQMGISRQREYLADETGARISGDPEALANALLKLQAHANVIPSTTAAAGASSLFIVNPFSGGASMMNWFSTHPPVEKRVEKLMSLRSDPAFVRLRAAQG